ncbi:polyprenyl synthetase family protein [Streptomyces sp. NPDC002952]|uniref:polyprenyl synthetase family protein n=1 Tax=Streptomyces sp. NPDC002952 TaxID=3364673 RepID=UPI0036B29B7E
MASVRFAELSVPALLEHGRAYYLPALRRAVAGLAAPLDTIVGYHFGWNEACGRPVAAGDGGKAVRPTLVLLAARAVGGDPAVAVPGAVAVELVHNFSLLHDDFMDRDETRRGRPTAWTVYGPARAVLAGDALFALASTVLLQAGAPAGRALHRLATANCRLIQGQADDLAFEDRDRITVQECTNMESGKTAALLTAACAMGAVLAGADDTTADALGRYGHHLGLAFQAVDDLLGIWGDPAVTGKPRWSDLHRRKKSLPICAALADNSPASRTFAHLLTTPTGQLDERRLAHCADLVEEAGGRTYTETAAAHHHADALAALDEVPMPTAVREHFTTLAAYVLRRDK